MIYSMQIEIGYCAKNQKPESEGCPAKGPRQSITVYYCTLNTDETQAIWE